MLLANTDQLLFAQHWLAQLAIPLRDIGAAMRTATITALSDQLDLAAVRAYWLAVGQRTREIVQQVTMRQLRQAVESARIAQVKAEGAFVPAAYGVA